MIELFQELSEANTLLQSALKRYVSACVALQGYCQSNESFGHRQTLRDVVVQELVSAAPHEVTLRSAKSVVSQARNTFTPIYTLPTELLVSIFDLVVGPRPCGVIEDSRPDIDAPKFPSFLLRVCSYWRHVALNTPSLWTHIDLAPGYLIGPAFAGCAELATAHSSDLLLDIHIRETDSLSLSDNSHARLLDLIRRVATRTRSFEFTIPGTTGFLSTRHRDILECCFNNCVPGTLAELAIKQHHGDYTFLEASSDEDLVNSPVDFDDPDRPLAVLIKTIEDLLLPITSLTLENVFFPWSYSAYHNLTELRLISSTETNTGAPELMAVLTSSPGLRVFHYNLDTYYLDTEGTPITPVQLPFLEVLKVGPSEFSEFKALAPFLSPGLRPLQLCFGWWGRSVLRDNHPITRFIERSNTTKIHVVENSIPGLCRGSELIDKLIHISPKLEILALERFEWEIQLDSNYPPPKPTISSSSRLNALYLLECRMDIHTLRRILESHRIEELTLWKCTIYEDYEQVLFEPETQRAFYDLCPNIHISREGPSPVENCCR